MEFRILGPLEVVHEGRRVVLGGSRERALLALLLLSANRVVSAERLAEDLWAGRPPQGAAQALRVYMSRLRKSLREAGGDGLLVTQPPGYVVQVGFEDLDAARFESLVARGRTQAAKGDHEGAAAALSEALSLWRGPALTDVADAPFARAEAARLAEARLAALEERAEADLACGRHGELVAELDALTRAHPLRERLWAQRMVALYRAGRQADALRAYQELRALLGDELGLEPSLAVARLEGAILRHEPELDWPPTDRRETSPPGPSAPLEGVVTFLFTDLVGSTQWLERLGEDAAEELHRIHYSLLLDAVLEAGGQEVKNLGDGLMVAFASPVAALGCAVGIQRQIAEYNRVQPERRLSVRVGLQTGEATRAEEDFFGTAVVVAKRLCDRAEGGEILAGELVTSLVGSRGDFRFRPLGPIALKGLANRIPAVAMAWQPEAEAGPEEKRAERSPITLSQFLTGAGRIFVGRERELDRLRVAWKEAGAGGRRVVLVGGEPGVGKTRLAAVLAEELHGKGATVLAGRCDEDLGVPYQPFVEALRHVADHTPPAHLATRLGRFGGELARLMPELAERAPGLATPLRSDPETERHRLFDAVAAFFGAVAAGDAVLLVLDDLQWAAKPTLLLLRHLVRSPACGQLLVLGTYRDTELPAGHPLLDLLADLRRDEAVERFSLSGLEEAEVLAVMEQAAGHDLDEEERAVVRAIHEETEGNPFFVWECARHLAETGVFVRQEGRWVTRRPELGVPEGVRDVVRRRLARLSEITNRVLSSAAVVGTDFDVSVLRAVCDLEEGELVVALDEAVAARLVKETGVGAYHFVHALVRSALYQTQSTTGRARLHLRVADAFEGDPARLAHHLLACAPLADATRTAWACLAAGDRALSALADAEAVDWYGQGLGFVTDDGQGPAVRIGLLIGLGEAQRRTGDPAYRQTLLDASHLADIRGDISALVRAVLANNQGVMSGTGRVDQERVALIQTALDGIGTSPSGERAALLALLAIELTYDRDHQRRLAAIDEATSIAAALDDPAVEAAVGVRRFFAGMVPGRISALAAAGRDTVVLADRSGDPQLRVLSRAFWCVPLQMTGQLRQACAESMEGVRIAEESGQPILRTIAHLIHGGNLDTVGERTENARLAQTMCEIGQQAGLPDAMEWYSAAMLVPWMFEGNVATAVEVAALGFATTGIDSWHAMWAYTLGLAGRERDLSELLAGIPSDFSHIAVDWLWVTSHLQYAAALGFSDAIGARHREEAATLYQRLLPYRALHGTFVAGYHGPVDIGLAVLARITGEYDAAVAHHQAAAATIEACGAVRPQAFNGYQWVVTLLARNAPGDRKRAAEMRQQTLEWCRARGYVTFERKLEELVI